MTDQVKTFGDTAKSLARNPLGIIALFIVMVYGFAAMVTAFAGAFTAAERLPLIYFLIIFPVLVLGVFAWLVSRHSGKLFAPSDFRNEENYVKMQMAVVASLTAASAKTETQADLHKIVEVARAASPALAPTKEDWRNHVLWVDDRPENNRYERQAFEAMGLRFTLALSTDEAFDRLERNRYAAIISDMGRREGPREGYVLLDRLRKEGNKTPLFFYASSNAPEHKRETREHGGQGCTNDGQELFEMVMSEVVGRQAA
ncbi:MAG: response regulator [Planctomycetes bacterium]|nr:response regulator [Planctomycetota bacterium]